MRYNGTTPPPAPPPQDRLDAAVQRQMLELLDSRLLSSHAIAAICRDERPSSARRRAALVAAVIAAAFYPQLARHDLRLAEEVANAADGRSQAGGVDTHLVLLIRDDGPIDEAEAEDDEDEEPNQARAHPTCVARRLGASLLASPYVSFYECVRTSDVFVRDATPTPPLAPLLFCDGALEEREISDGCRVYTSDAADDRIRV